MRHILFENAFAYIWKQWKHLHFFPQTDLITIHSFFTSYTWNRSTDINFSHTVIFGIPNKMVPTKNMAPKKSDHKQSDSFIIMLTESPVTITLPVPVGYYHKWKPHSTAETRHWDFLAVLPLTASFVTFLHLFHAPKLILYILIHQLPSCLSEIFVPFTFTW